MRKILWEGKKIPIIFSGRKTVSIIIREGNIEVRAPYGTSEARISAFLNEKKNWILKHTERKPEVKVLKKSIWYRGKEYPLEIGQKTELKDGVFYAPDMRYAIAWLKRETLRVLAPELKTWAKKMGRGSEKEARVTDATGRWASNGVHINLNWRLICVSPELAEYVLVHELAHEFHRDHSKDFWKQVEKFMPDYRIRRKELKNKFAFLMREP